MNHSKELQEKINLAEYGKAMRAARMKAGYTLMRLTEESGIGENGICKYESGQTNPTVTYLRRLKRRGLPAQQWQPTEYQHAIPVCPTLLTEVTLSAQLRPL